MKKKITKLLSILLIAGTFASAFAVVTACGDFGVGGTNQEQTGGNQGGNSGNNQGGTEKPGEGNNQGGNEKPGESEGGNQGGSQGSVEQGDVYGTYNIVIPGSGKIDQTSKVVISKEGSKIVDGEGEYAEEMAITFENTKTENVYKISYTMTIEGTSMDMVLYVKIVDNKGMYLYEELEDVNSTTPKYLAVFVKGTTLPDDLKTKLTADGYIQSQGGNQGGNSGNNEQGNDECEVTPEQWVELLRSPVSYTGTFTGYSDGVLRTSITKVDTLNSVMENIVGSQNQFVSYENGITYAYILTEESYIKINPGAGADYNLFEAESKGVLNTIAKSKGSFKYENQQYFCPLLEISGEDGTIKNITVKFKNGNLESVYYTIVNEDGESSASYTEINSTVVTLPTNFIDASGNTPGGGNQGDVEGDSVYKINEEDWEAAILQASKNFTMTEGNDNFSFLFKMSDAGLYFDATEEQMIVKLEENYYVITMNTDTNEWEGQQIPEEDYNQFILNFPVFVNAFKDDVNSFRYSADKKAYVCDSLDKSDTLIKETLTDIVIKFQNGKVVYMEYSLPDSKIIVNNIGSTAFEIPEFKPVEGGGDYIPEEGKCYVFDYFERYDVNMNGEWEDWTQLDAAIESNQGHTFTFSDGVIIDYNANLDMTCTISYEFENGVFVVTDYQGEGAVPMEYFNEIYFEVYEDTLVFYQDVAYSGTRFIISTVCVAVN